MNPTVCLLGNSTVRLYPVIGNNLMTARLIEWPTARFLKSAAVLRKHPLLQRPLVVCSVQREALALVRRLALAVRQPLQVYGAEFGPGLPVRLSRAARATVGRDRLAGCKAALDEFPRGAVVCDVGTALTVNRVTVRGFEGGLIAPGLELGLRALHVGTSQLPLAGGVSGRNSRTPGRFPAKNTETAMELGCLYSVAGAIEKAYRNACRKAGDGGREIRRENRSGPTLPLLLTGGGGIMIRRFLALPVLWRPHLVARGVWLAYQESALL